MGSKHGEQNKNSVPCLQPLHGAAAPRGSGAAPPCPGCRGGYESHHPLLTRRHQSDLSGGMVWSFVLRG